MSLWPTLGQRTVRNSWSWVHFLCKSNGSDLSVHFRRAALPFININSNANQCGSAHCALLLVLMDWSNAESSSRGRGSAAAKMSFTVSDRPEIDIKNERTNKRTSNAQADARPKQSKNRKQQKPMQQPDQLQLSSSAATALNGTLLINVIRSSSLRERTVQREGECQCCFLTVTTIHLTERLPVNGLKVDEAC